MRRFTLRGKTNVGTQSQLYCLVHNIEKIATGGDAIVLKGCGPALRTPVCRRARIDAARGFAVQCRRISAQLGPHELPKHSNSHRRRASCQKTG